MNGWNAHKLADDQVAHTYRHTCYEIAVQALRSIATSACCTPCQEARTVARSALRSIGVKLPSPR